MNSVTFEVTTTQAHRLVATGLLSGKSYEQMTLERRIDILNHYQITDLIASSGQPTSEKFRDIAAQSYGVIINLAMSEHKQSICTDGSLFTTLGMNFIHIPVPFDAPSENHNREFTGHMDALKDRKVWLHCIGNSRVSAFFFRYL